MISSKDISVVVQGAINKKYTKEVLHSIRKSLPKSQIILSTWEGSDITGLDYDIIILNKDPGAEILFPQWNQYHNLNRQILSTKNGINKANKKYILKIRTDIKLEGTGFLSYFLRFKKRHEYFKILNERVIVCENFVRDPKLFPYHISDWVFFGLHDDVQNIWDIPLAPEPETTKYFYNHPLLPEHKNGGPYSHFRHRYCAEQYIWISFLKKNGYKIKFDNMWDFSYENIYNTKLSFVNNIVIISCKEFGINFLKSKIPHQYDIYNYNKWLDLYITYCDNSCNERKRFYLSSDDKFEKYSAKLLKHIKNIIKPINHFFSWIGEFGSTIFYVLKLSCRIIRILYKNFNYKSKEYSKLEFLLKYIPSSKKTINLLDLATGESYIFATQYAITNQNDTIWCTTRKSTYQIFQMFQPGVVKFISIDKKLYLKKSFYTINGVNINVFLPDEFWFDFWKTKTHFLDALHLYLANKISKKLNLHPKFIEQDILSFNAKIESIKLNLDKFIIISPEASSMDKLDDDFWYSIINNAKSKGYDIYCNTTTGIKFPNCKVISLNFKEFYLLALKAKSIIGLRSGLMEIISSINIPLFVIYNLQSNNANPFLKNIYNNYTLQHYPNIGLFLKEFIINNDIDEKHIQNAIFHAL